MTGVEAPGKAQPGHTGMEGFHPDLSLRLGGQPRARRRRTVRRRQSHHRDSRGRHRARVHRLHRRGGPDADRLPLPGHLTPGADLEVSWTAVCGDDRVIFALQSGNHGLQFSRLTCAIADTGHLRVGTALIDAFLADFYPVQLWILQRKHEGANNAGPVDERLRAVSRVACTSGSGAQVRGYRLKSLPIWEVLPGCFAASRCALARGPAGDSPKFVSDLFPITHNDLSGFRCLSAPSKWTRITPARRR